MVLIFEQLMQRSMSSHESQHHEIKLSRMIAADAEIEKSFSSFLNPDNTSQSLNKYVFSAYYVLGIVLGAGDVAVN